MYAYCVYNKEHPYCMGGLTGKNLSDNCITKCVKNFLEHFYSFKFADLKGGDAVQTASGHLSVKVAFHFMVKALLKFSG